jgi:hypothetical protein
MRARGIATMARRYAAKRVTIAVCAATTVALAAWPVTVPAQAAELTAAKTVVYGFNEGQHCPPTNWRKPAIRPAGAALTLPCELAVRHLHWRYWHRNSAFAHGTIVLLAGRTTRHAGSVALSVGTGAASTSRT